MTSEALTGLTGVLVALAVIAGDAPGGGAAMAADAVRQPIDASVAPATDNSRKLIWKRQFGTKKDDFTTGVATDADDNVLSVGTTAGSLDGASKGGRDAFVAKYSSSGAKLWLHQLGSSADDRAEGVAADGQGNVFIAGETGGDLGAGYLGRGDLFLAKYNAAGDLLWVRDIGTAEFETDAAVAVDDNGDVVVSGLTSGSLGGANPNGRYQAVVAKYTNAGDQIWITQFGTTDLDCSALAVATDTDRNLLVAGYTTGSLASNQTGGAFVAKYSPGGSLRWIRQFDAGESSSATAVAADSQGDAVITVASKFREFVVKYSAGGTLSWSDEVGAGTGPRRLTGVAVDGDDNIAATGYTYGSIGGPNKGDGDAFLIKYEPIGQRLWKRQIGTNVTDWSTRVATDSSDNIVIAGWTYGALVGANRGGADVFIAKFAP